MVKVKDIAFGRLRSPDLDLQEKFLTDFGMTRAARTKDKLFMRGTDPDHHIHVTELGDPAFVGIAFHAHVEEDLHTLSKGVDGASAVEEIDEPGAGKRVRLTDPNGLQIEVIWGQETLDPLPVPEHRYNWGYKHYQREGELMRVKSAPSHVKRSAHGVFLTNKLEATMKWYQDNLGFQTTDIISNPEDKTKPMAVFNHIDAPNPDEFVDHHVFLFFEGPELRFNHLSFEVSDLDDVHTGHHHMKEQGYTHAWGVGRHYLGSQIFDYWRDPWGRIHEHWTDSDVINNQHVPSMVSPEEGLQNQWGPDFPWSFIDDPAEHATAGK